VAAGADPKVSANWIMGDIMAHLKQEKAAITDIRLSAAGLAELLALIAEGAISGKVGACLLLECQVRAPDFWLVHRRLRKTSSLRCCKKVAAPGH
jgi:aspartyl-tRNA(Asn)/glutamyl-tRNA(Gln) amidotransferase subunit B